ncbi:MAG: 30S ribosomal protein S2 [SAR324 cluster bacterium]|nr:30S ribosomal protein S2 [SAR324 cluster bacterium]
MAVITMKQFLEAGVHFGHQTKRWHPNMSPYIYGIKNGVHVIDLRLTLTKLKEAYEYVKASAAEGRVPLFVGTKIQIQRIVKEEAERCGSPYINFRWLGGLLTNFGTVKQSIGRLKSFEEIAGEDRSYEGVIKKEALMMERKRVKLERSLGGVRNMKSIPSMLFITDCHREQLALKEAQKLGIPVVGVADTNCDPTGIDYVIPGNDDSPRAVALYANIISTAVLEGLAVRKQARIAVASEEKATAKKAKPTTKVVVKKAGEAAANKTKPAVKVTKVKTAVAPQQKPAEQNIATEKAASPSKAKGKDAEVKAAEEKPAAKKTAVKAKKTVEKAKPLAKATVKDAKVVTEVKAAEEKPAAKKTAVKAKKTVEKTKTTSTKKTPAAKAKKVETKK